MFKRILPVAAVAAVGAFALGGVAHASVNPSFSYTAKSAAAVSGYFAHGSSSAVNFTHITSYVGNDGSANQEQLAVTPAAGLVAGDHISGIANAVGIGLCNQSLGTDAQLGEVYIGNGLMDIVDGAGQLTTPVNGDKCQSGILGSAGTIVLAGVPVNDTVQLDVLYDYAHAYTYRGRHHAAGTITFSATDLSANAGVTAQGTALPMQHNVIFNEGDAGSVADAGSVIPLSGVPPFTDVKNSPDLLATFAHVALNGNVTGGAEVQGSIQNSSAWNAFGVAATKTGMAPTGGNPVYLGPTTFFDDHFKVYIGQPVSG
jgi:hypothetical protein